MATVRHVVPSCKFKKGALIVNHGKVVISIQIYNVSVAP